MRNVRRISTLMGIVLLGAVATLAPSPGMAAVGLDPEILALREAAWRAWFSGDEAALRRILPADFIGLDANGGPLYNLEQTIERA